MELKNDLLTGEEFIPLRRNQKFASRKNQIKYNNLLAQQKRDLKRPMDQALDRNRSIMVALLGDAKSVTKSKEFLLGAGYNFTAFTQTAKNELQKYYCVYDMALFPLGDEKFLIKRR